MGINVLSLFDGIACGLVALEKAGIAVDKYLASEIDRPAIEIATNNHPWIDQIGDVTKVHASPLPKIDLLLGGSPCQGFSFAGKQLNFDDPRSALLFEYVRLLKECKPEYFLLENVKMKKEYQAIISASLGVEPIEINSALVSAQNRKRLYWTNIPGIKQPKDKKITLKDILIRENSGRLPVKLDRRKSDKYIYTPHKAPCICSSYAKGLDNHGQRIGVIHTNFSKTKTKHYNKSCALRAGASANYQVVFDERIPPKKWQKLTPLECERLQTLPDDYTKGVSNTQRYKAIGNGWTVDVVAHILSYLEYLL